MARTPYGLPRPGSTAWAAKKVERLLDREAKDRQTETRRRWAEEARPFKVRDHPVGGDSWAAQQIRLIRQREARARLGLVYCLTNGYAIYCAWPSATRARLILTRMSLPWAFQT